MHDSFAVSLHVEHSATDVDFIEALESVRVILTEGKRSGAVDFFIGGDLNVELKLNIADYGHKGLDNIEWFWMYGPECKGGGEDIVVCEKKRMVPVIARLQLRDQHLDEQ